MAATISKPPMINFARPPEPDWVSIFSSMLLSIPVKNHPAYIPTGQKERRLLKQNQHLVLLIVDEMSMMSAELFALLESYARCTTHGHAIEDETKTFGNIPVVVIVGDIGQLPSIGKGPIDALSIVSGLKEKPKRERRGFQLFRQFAQDVMTLHAVVRQSKSQKRFQTYLGWHIQWKSP